MSELINDINVNYIVDIVEECELYKIKIINIIDIYKNKRNNEIYARCIIKKIDVNTFCQAYIPIKLFLKINKLLLFKFLEGKFIKI